MSTQYCTNKKLDASEVDAHSSLIPAFVYVFYAVKSYQQFRKEYFFQHFVIMSMKHSTQVYSSSSKGKSLTTTSYSISRSMLRPHIITEKLSRHRFTTRAFKAQSKCIYAFDLISLPLYHVAAGLLGSLSVGSNLRPQIEA